MVFSLWFLLFLGCEHVGCTSTATHLAAIQLGPTIPRQCNFDDLTLREFNLAEVNRRSSFGVSGGGHADSGSAHSNGGEHREGDDDQDGRNKEGSDGRNEEGSDGRGDEEGSSGRDHSGDESSGGRGGENADGPGRPDDQNRWDDPLTRDDGAPATPVDDAQPSTLPVGVYSTSAADVNTWTDGAEDDDWTTSAASTSSSFSSAATSDTDEDSVAFGGGKDRLGKRRNAVLAVVLGLVMADHLL